MSHDWNWIEHLLREESALKVSIDARDGAESLFRRGLTTNADCNRASELVKIRRDYMKIALFDAWPKIKELLPETAPDATRDSMSNR